MRQKLARMVLLGAVAATLACSSGCSLLGRKQQATAPVNDSRIQSQLEAALAQEPMLKNCTISVSSDNAVVTLTGSVDSISQKERAGQVATSVSNVEQVKNNLLVRTPAAR